MKSPAPELINTDCNGYAFRALRYSKGYYSLNEFSKATTLAVKYIRRLESKAVTTEGIFQRWCKFFGLDPIIAIHINDSFGGVTVGNIHSLDIARLRSDVESIIGHPI